MTNIRGTLIGVYNADGGIVGELTYVLGHLIGVRSCSLCDISHSPIKKKSSFKELEQHLLNVSKKHLKAVSHACYWNIQTSRFLCS